MSTWCCATTDAVVGPLVAHVEPSEVTPIDRRRDSVGARFTPPLTNSACYPTSARQLEATRRRRPGGRDLLARRGRHSTAPSAGLRAPERHRPRLVCRKEMAANGWTPSPGWKGTRSPRPTRLALTRKTCATATDLRCVPAGVLRRVALCASGLSPDSLLKFPSRLTPRQRGGQFSAATTPMTWSTVRGRVANFAWRTPLRPPTGAAPSFHQRPDLRWPQTVDASLTARPSRRQRSRRMCSGPRRR